MKRAEISELEVTEQTSDGHAVATFRAYPGSNGVTMNTPGGIGVTIPESEALRLYGWLGDVLGNPERDDAAAKGRADAARSRGARMERARLLSVFRTWRESGVLTAAATVEAVAELVESLLAEDY
jgi:hypothetical protein